MRAFAWIEIVLLGEHRNDIAASENYFGLSRRFALCQFAQDAVWCMLLRAGQNHYSLLATADRTKQPVDCSFTKSC